MRYIVFIIIAFSNLFAQISTNSLQQMANEELDKIKEDLSKQIESSSKVSKNKVETIIDNVNIASEKATTESKIFGHSFFENDINFFDNVPTPDSYLLGPGDEIVLSIWGDTNLRSVFTINKNGLIYFENIGLINISNKTISEAEDLLKVELLNIYSTLGTSSNLTIELSKLKSLNIFFTGELNNPGISLVHPFSSPLTAIIQAGGITKNASIRNIQIFRNNNLLTTIDFYDFFLSGNPRLVNIKLIDGDTIHVPVIQNKVQLIGELIRPGDYEFLSNESLKELLETAGGLKPTAASKAIIRQIDAIDKRLSDDYAMKGEIVNLSNSSSTFINNGAIVEIPKVSANMIDVDVYGRVNFPGTYPINTTTTLKDILDLAGGFDDPFFRKTIFEDITVLRLNESDFYATELIVNYEDSESFQLMVGDKIFVYENSNFENALTYSIKGEVNKPGTYTLVDNLSLNDAINIAGGVTEIGSINSVSVTKEILTLDGQGNTSIETEKVANTDLNFEITDKNIITVLPKSNVIKVSGNVYNPGLVSLSGKNNISMSKAIELAGGYKPFSLKRRSYVVRANGEIEQANIFRGRAKRVFSGDSVFIPKDENPDEFDITSFIADLSTTLANIAAILIVIDNQND